MGKFWLEHPKRKQYLDGVVFKPVAECKPSELNLWVSFDVAPNPGGSWKSLQEHILHILCGGNEEVSAYFIGWMAHMIQFPHLQAGVAVVMRGDEGSLYPPNWKELSHRVRFERARGRCEACGRPHAHLIRCLPTGDGSIPSSRPGVMAMAGGRAGRTCWR